MIFPFSIDGEIPKDLLFELCKKENNYIVLWSHSLSHSFAVEQFEHFEHWE